MIDDRVSCISCSHLSKRFTCLKSVVNMCDTFNLDVLHRCDDYHQKFDLTSIDDVAKAVIFFRPNRGRQNIVLTLAEKNGIEKNKVINILKN